MNDIFENFNRVLDEMIKETEYRIEERDKRIKELLKDNPDELLRYENGCFKLEKWIEANPYKCPPPAEFFLK